MIFASWSAYRQAVVLAQKRLAGNRLLWHLVADRLQLEVKTSDP